MCAHGCPRDFIGPYTKVTVRWAALGAGGSNIKIPNNQNKIIPLPPHPIKINCVCVSRKIIDWGSGGPPPEQFLEN